ncbi:hypothetical protein EBU91_04570, partial [bacterium]|nr:hypothetical protein [bacterium]
MYNKNTSKTEDYREEIISALNTPITPENLSKYIPNALSEILTTIHNFYDKSQSLKNRPYDKIVEDEILTQLGFSGLPIIDILAGKIDQLAQIDNLVATFRSKTDGDSIHKKIELVLYILITEYSIDFNDQNQFEIERGYLIPGNKIIDPYFIITVPVINATFLVSNYELADTYVFDNKKLKENRIFSDKIKQITISEIEIDKLLDSTPGVGICIDSKLNLASNILPAIRAAVFSDLINFYSDKYDKSHEVALLKNKSIENIPQGYSFLFDLANSMGITIDSLNSLIESVPDKIGEIKLYRLYIGKIEPCLSPEQQSLIRDLYTSTPLVPEGYTSLYGFINNLGINDKILTLLTNSLYGKIGKISKYRLSSGGIKDCLSPQQQKIITEAYNNFPLIPSGYVSFSSFAQSKNISLPELNKLIRNQLGSSIEVKMFRLPIGRIEECLSKEQQILLNQTNDITNDLPQGYVTMTTFAQNMGINDEILTKMIISVGNRFGSISKFRINLADSVSCLSPQQQEIIK